MPLLNREEHPPGASSVAGLKPGDDVFVLAHTGDVMKSYAEFADRKHQHSLPQWQDKYYCKSGLSYTDALAYEKHAEQQLRKQVGSRGWAASAGGRTAASQRPRCTPNRRPRGGGWVWPPPRSSAARTHAPAHAPPAAAVPQGAGGPGGAAHPPQHPAQG
jgi:hypothetical protein